MRISELRKRREIEENQKLEEKEDVVELEIARRRIRLIRKHGEII